MKRHGKTTPLGFSLVITVSLMVLLSVVALGLLGLSTIGLRASTTGEARAVAMANARLGLMMALGQLQQEVGDDRRVTADASILSATKNPAAVGVWNAWSPDLASKSGGTAAPSVDYSKPKGQGGFRRWLVSSADPAKARMIDWHLSGPGAASARLHVEASSGFDLGGEKIPVAGQSMAGSLAWVVTQENTKARVNVGTDDTKRISLDDRMQAPSRPDLSLSPLLQQPVDDDWNRRSAAVCRLSEAALDPAYGVSPEGIRRASKDFTVDSLSLLTNPVKGGLKVDLTTGFDMTDAEFASDSWDGVNNPFRAIGPTEYRGQKPLYQPFSGNPQVQVYMNFDPASVNHKFNVNGVPTFDTLRACYRTYRHLFNSNLGGTTGFERPMSHVGIPDRVSGRPFGLKTQPALAPVLDRVNLVFSVLAKADGTLCILLSPFVTIWNPHNVEIETEGLVIYPWIDFAVFWSYNVTTKTEGTKNWSTSLSRMVGEGFQGHGRSTRPYFYLHLTQSGNAVSGGTKTVSPAIHLDPGEVRVFCMAEPRKDLEIFGNAQARTWRMKPVAGPSDITSSLKSGIILNLLKCLDGPAMGGYKLKSGDIVNANDVGFDRSTYYYIVNMADSWQIKNPAAELMVEARPAYGSLPALPAEKNLVFYGQIHSHRAEGRGRDTFSYPRYTFKEINETPRMVGSLLTYHRVAQSSTLPLADLMFTTNPRQPFVNQYLSGGNFQTGPHYESLLQGGTTLVQLAMETTGDGRMAYYGPSHSAASGRTNLAFFEIPRSPTLSLGSFQHCDITATAFGCASQIANSWASPYLSSASVSKRVATAPGGESITPSGLGVYDASYLANETLFDGYYLSGAAPRFGTRKSAVGGPAVWEQDQISEDVPTGAVIERFFTDPVANPLRNPRMVPHPGGLSVAALGERLAGPAKCVRLAAHLMVEGGFNVNSTSEEAWTAVLASLRGARPASAGKTAQSRFRHILSGPPVNMAENDPWCGFRTLTDSEVRLLAKNLVAEIKARGPFLSLGEFVNRRISTDKKLALSGAIQGAIDKSNLNARFGYSKFDTTPYPNRENIPNPNTGTNTPGWLTQADVLHALAPFITARSDTFMVRSMGEARDGEGRVIASVRLEALVQRLPRWVDPADDPATAPADLKSAANKDFGRRFQILSLREVKLDPSGNPV